MGRRACTEPQCLYKGALYFYILYIGNSLPTLRNNLQGSTKPRSFLHLFTDRLSRNVGKELIAHDVLYLRRERFSSTSRRKSEITEPIIFPKCRYQAFNIRYVTSQKSKSFKLHCDSMLSFMPGSYK